MRGDFLLTGDGLECVAVVNVGDGVRALRQVDEEGTVHTVVVSDLMLGKLANWEEMGGPSNLAQSAVAGAATA